MTTEELRFLSEVNSAWGFMLISKEHPDVKIGRRLAKMGLIDKLEDRAPTIVFFRNGKGLEAAAHPPAAPGSEDGAI